MTGDRFMEIEYQKIEEIPLTDEEWAEPSNLEIHQ